VNIGHVSVRVGSPAVDRVLQELGLTVNGEDKANKIARMGDEGDVVSLREARPAGMVEPLRDQSRETSTKRASATCW
jgi:hypothetical protein